MILLPSLLPMNLASEESTLFNAHVFDYVPILIYFSFVIGVGFIMKKKAASADGFLTGGRSIPAWVTGIAFVSANLGAVEIMGMSANGAQYGMPTFHYFWVGAIPCNAFPWHCHDALLLRLQGPFCSRVHVQALREDCPSHQLMELCSCSAPHCRYQSLPSGKDY